MPRAQPRRIATMLRVASASALCRLPPPRSSEIAVAAFSTSAAKPLILCGLNRSAGPDSPMAAMTCPLPSQIGAATP